MSEKPWIAVRTRPEAGRRLIACWARLLGRECTHPADQRVPLVPFIVERCKACGFAIRIEVTRG